MIVHAELDATQGAAMKAEATRRGITANELARQLVARWLYEQQVRHMDPTRQPKEHVTEADGWL